MSAEIILRVSPDEQELARKRGELDRLQTKLADRELHLANLQAELTTFQKRYLREIGPLYAELDDWSAKIAEWLSKAANSGPGSAEFAEWSAKIAQLAAEEQNAKETTSNATRPHTGRINFAVQDGDAEDECQRSADLKSLYREVAKRVHPDLATDETNRSKRELLMKQANEAYRRGDREALRRILEEYESSPESVEGKGIAADLARVTRQIRQIQARLAQIDRHVVDLMNSRIAKLKAKAEEMKVQGRDLLSEMAEDLRRRIQLVRHTAGNGRHC